MKKLFAKLFACYITNREKKWIDNPIKTQEKVFYTLVKNGKNTIFGKNYNFSKIKNYNDFKKNVPVNDYEDIRPYIEKIINGEENVLWRGRPIYLAKTSGTTSGIKYIPITKDSMPSHINSVRNAILTYIHETGKINFIKGKMIFLQGSPILKEKNGIKIGRLSGISAHYVPAYLQKNRLPSWKTNCIDDWNKKVDEIIKETINEKMSLISGIPSWVQMYFEKLTSISNKKIKDIFPDFSLFITGGVNLEPYKEKFNYLIGKTIDTIELYPASEGFFAYQNSQKDNSLLLILNNGIFYEFIEANNFFKKNCERINIQNINIGINYVMIISTNAGLWGYNTGDTVEFISKNPYKIKITGRLKHFTSAFGEHVITKEVETALNFAISASGGKVTEFTVAPLITPKEGLPYHEWFIEFEEEPYNINDFAQNIDKKMQEQNIYYKDLITGNILRPVIITKIKKHGFYNYMKEIGKLGGQNKIPKLSNDRKIADILQKYSIN